MTRTTAERNLAAEVRAVEAGLRAFVQPGGSIRVASDSHKGEKHYVVSFAGTYVDGTVVFACTPDGEAAYRDDHLHVTGQPGIAPCLHAAAAARRLEREGLIRLTPVGEWVATAKAAAPRPPDDDPFAVFGAPKRPTGTELLEAM